MNRQEFTATIPGKNQVEKADFLDCKQPTLSTWTRKQPATAQEEILLRGWALLTPEQRDKIFEGVNN